MKAPVIALIIVMGLVLVVGLIVWLVCLVENAKRKNRQNRWNEEEKLKDLDYRRKKEGLC